MHFYQRLIAVLILSIMPISLLSQANIDFKEVDSLTYSYVLQKDWDNLIATGNAALAEGLDYYYLRLRLGIAYFEKGYYTLAARHTTKALEYNFRDPTAQLYLYESYLHMGKPYLARKLRASFSPKTDELIKKKDPLVSFVDVGGGYVLSNNFDKNNDMVYGSNGGMITGSESQVGNKTIVFTLLELNLSPSVTYGIGANKLNIKKRSAFQYPEMSLVLDSTVNHVWGFQNYFTVSDSMVRKTFDNSIKQNELYQNVKFQLGRQWAVSLFANIIFVNAERTIPQSNRANKRRINYRVIGQPPVFINFPYDSLSFHTSDSSFVNYLVGFNLEKDLNNVSFNLTGTYSSLNLSDQIQTGISSYYFIVPSARLYGITSVYLFYDNNDIINDNTKFIFVQKFGGQILNKLWGSMDFAYNVVSNSNFSDGYMIYNQSDNAKYNLGAKLSWYINNKISLSLYYKYTSYEGAFYRYIPTEESPVETISRKYINNNLIAGLKWNF